MTVGELPIFIPSLVHGQPFAVRMGNNNGESNGIQEGSDYSNAYETKTIGGAQFNSVGDGQYHNNIQPAYTVYRFRRIS